jgi:hypothetical protein
MSEAAVAVPEPVSKPAPPGHAAAAHAPAGHAPAGHAASGHAASGNEAAAASAPRANSQIIELRTSSHLMALDPGIFCVVRHPSAVPVDPANGLPAVRISAPPGRDLGRDGVSVTGFQDGGWLGPESEVALIRVTGPGAHILVTIYQLPQQGPEAAPRLQVMRMAADPRALAPAAGLPAAGLADMALTGKLFAHEQRVGDVAVPLGQRVGTEGSKLWIEGFAVHAPEGVAPEEIEYQAVLGRGWSSPWHNGGKYCGSRGMALPLLGVRIRLTGAAAEAYRVSYSATFIDGSTAGPSFDGEDCESAELAPLESLQVALTPVGEPADIATKAPAARKKAPVKPAPAKPAAAKRGR